MQLFASERFELENRSAEKDPYWFSTLVWAVFKILPIAGGCLGIYLGYKLFILGVTGEASIVVDVKGVGGQLINAAPGLFFAVGGFVVLIMVVVKGGKMAFTSRGSRKVTPADQ